MSIYGYCKECEMKLVSRDNKVAPPGICEGCFTLEMNEDYDIHPDDYEYMSIQELWALETESVISGS